MLIIGLTGGIGMGKSNAARILSGLGLPIYDADASVHQLLAKNGRAVKAVGRLFPESLKGREIDRQQLGQMVFKRPRKLRALEKILHPLVQDTERVFLDKARQAKAKAVVLEIPLLFETGSDKRCDVTVCVTAPKAIQKKRVLARQGMTNAKFNAILKQQLLDRDRCARADYVVPSGKGNAETSKHLKRIIKLILETN